MKVKTAVPGTAVLSRGSQGKFLSIFSSGTTTFPGSGVAVGGKVAVAVGGTSVAVAVGSGVDVGGIGVDVGGSAVAVGGTGVGVGADVHAVARTRSTANTSIKRFMFSSVL